MEWLQIFGAVSGSGAAVLFVYWVLCRHFTPPEPAEPVRCPGCGHSRYAKFCARCGYSALPRWRAGDRVVLHHIDGNRRNNAPDNLAMLPAGQR